MEAIYFGNIKVWGYGTGNGPWIMADMENGLYSGVNAGYNANDPTISDRFTTAMIEGRPNQWAILGGNAQSGGLSTFYSGARPNVSGYEDRMVDVQRGRQPAMASRQRDAGQPGLRQMPGRPRLQHHARNPAPALHLQRRQQPEMGAALTSP